MTHWIDKFYWFALGFLYLAFALPLIPLGTDDIRMVAVFSVDESDILNQVYGLYTRGVFQKPSFTYGGGTYYAVLSLVWIWDLFSVVDEQVVALALRFLCLIAGFGCLGLVVKIGTLVFDRQIGQLGALLLLATPVFLHWTVEGHPDLPQLFWVLCTLFMCLRLCDSFSFKFVIVASLFAGIAFGTKYGGAFLLPIIGTSIFFTSESGVFQFSRVLENLKMPKRWGALLCVPVVFLLAFAMLNPYAVIHFDLFVQKMQSYRSVMSAGHTYVGESAGYFWLVLIVGHLGAMHTAVLFAGLMSEKRVIRTDRLILILWCITLVAYLWLNIQMRHMRHVLPILPCIVLFVGAGYFYIARWASRRANLPVFVFLIFFVGVGLVVPVRDVIALFDHKWSANDRREDVVAGKWLADTFSEETTILYDVYAYIPSKFQKALPAIPAMTYSIVTHFEPDVLVVRDARHARYNNLADSNQVSVGKRVFFDIHYFYPYLQGSRLPDYKLARAFERTFIFKRVLPRNHSFSFASCYQMLQNGQMLNEVSARERMGDAAMQAGHWQEALREFEIAASSLSDMVMLRYKLGRVQALLGMADESQENFKFVLDKRAEVSDQERADILWDIGQYYFAGALYELALDYLNRSFMLQKTKAATHFDLAACHLALGQVDVAIRQYENAIAQFGSDETVVVKLKALRDRQIQVNVVDQILNQHF